MRKTKLPTRTKTTLTILLDILLWLLLAAIIYLFPPTNPYVILSFFLLLTLALFLPLKLLIKPLRRAILLTILITTLLTLRFYYLDQWINVTLLIGLIITIELFLW
jgi:hypothetical protein